MWDDLFIYLFIIHSVGFAECPYPPMGDEVQAGSVLLPASRRGRYLANIARRQAVDGTGFKFNKDADRMNAEAKKKMDVLSEELLPYIIAEQERRITLYKRVMTAIQNGEKGVTIVEIRNKPPAIIRKGLMYRCPTNREPREPDGSGVIICEDDLKPTPIMFESCLSAEDKELYVAENKYFFCNRHKVEGPDLPRNGTMVIGCAPCERTPLNYTSRKCALEDTDDVVVHYRYYPDRTYKFVSELDPLHEVCDHWNPCQVGYIFSLPGPDQATPASELWHTDEEDYIVETVSEENLGEKYTTGMIQEAIPDGFKFAGIGFHNGTNYLRLVPKGKIPKNMKIYYEVLKGHVKVTFKFNPLLDGNYGRYYVSYHKINGSRYGNYYDIILNIERGLTKLKPTVLDAMPRQQLNLTSVTYTCKQCALDGIILRATDGSGSTRDLEGEKYRLRNLRQENVIEFEFGTVKASDFGDYFLIIRIVKGREERVKAISIKVISLECIRTAATVGEPVDMNTTYKCVNASCKLVDVLCHGESVLASDGVKHITTSKRISLNLASFEDQNACVYLAKFKIGDDLYRKNVAIFEKVELVPVRLKPPEERKPFELNIKYKCKHPDCRLNKVTVNGFPLETTKQSSVGSEAYYLSENSSLTIIITEYSSLHEGVYQGVFALGADQVTKTLMEIGPDVVEHQNQDNVPETESLTEAAAEGDRGKEAPLSGGEPERNHWSTPGTRRSAPNADKSTAA